MKIGFAIAILPDLDLAGTLALARENGFDSGDLMFWPLASGDSRRYPDVTHLDVGRLDGRLRPVYERLPKITPSKEGNLIMRWNDGMPLSKFIDYLVMLMS